MSSAKGVAFRDSLILGVHMHLEHCYNPEP